MGGLLLRRPPPPLPLLLLLPQARASFISPISSRPGKHPKVILPSFPLLRALSQLVLAFVIVVIVAIIRRRSHRRQLG